MPFGALGSPLPRSCTVQPVVQPWKLWWRGQGVTWAASMPASRRPSSCCTSTAGELHVDRGTAHHGRQPQCGIELH